MAVAKKVNEERAAEIKQALAEMFGGKKPEDGNAEDLEAARQIRQEHVRQSKEQHYWIELIQRQDDKEGAVAVHAAGVSYLLPKGVRLAVPISVVNCLNMARVESEIPVVGARPGETKIVRYKRFDFSEYGPASAEEVKKFKADQKKRDTPRNSEETREQEVIGRPEIEYSDAQMTPLGD